MVAQRINSPQDSSQGFKNTMLQKISDGLVRFLQQKNISQDQVNKQEFFAWLRGNYNGVLDAMSDQQLKVYYGMIQDLGISAKGLQDNHSAMRERLRDQRFEEEEEAVNSMLQEIRTTLGDDVLFQQFASANHFDASNAGSCRISYNMSGVSSDVLSIAQVKRTWRQFASSKGIAADKQKQINDAIMEPMLYDQTEKMLLTATISKRCEEALRVSNNNSTIKAFFDDAPLLLPLHAFSYADGHGNYRSLQLGDLPGLFAKFQTTVASASISQDKKDNLVSLFDRLVVSNNDVLAAYQDPQHSGASTAEISTIRSDKKTMNERSDQAAAMFNKLSSEALMDEYNQQWQQTNDSLEATLGLVQNVPPHFKQLFGQYGSDLSTLKRFDSSLPSKIKGFQDQITRVQQQGGDTTSEVRRLEQAIEQAKWQVYLKQIAADKPPLAAVLQKAEGLGFRMHLLSVNEQQIIIDALLDISLSQVAKDNMASLYGMEGNQYEAFVRDLFNLSKTSISIPTKRGDVPIDFEKKGFLETGVDPTQFSMEGLKAFDHLGLDFRVKVTDQNKSFLEAIYGKSKLLHPFHQKDGPPVLLHDGYKVTLSKDGVSYPPGYLSLVGKGLNEQNPHAWYLYTSPTSIHDPNRDYVRDSNGNPVMVERESDTGEGIVNGERQWKLSIDHEPQLLNLSGDTIGGLLALYALGRDVPSKQDVTDVRELGDKMGDFLEQQSQKGKNYFQDPYQDTRKAHQLTTGDDSVVDTDNDHHELADADKRAVEQQWNAIQPGGLAIDLEEGASLRVQEGESNIIPRSMPFDTGGYRYQYTIKKIDWNDKKITFVKHGGDQLLEDEGKTYTVDLNTKLFDQLRTILGVNLYKMPPAPAASDFTTIWDHLQKAAIPRVSQHLENLSGQLTRDNGKFASVYDNKKDDVASFAVEAGDADGIPTIASFEATATKAGKIRVKAADMTEEEKDSDGKITKRTQWAYEKEMDYADFLLFVGENRLVPYTKAQLTDFEDRRKAAKEMGSSRADSRPLKWFSPSEIAAGLKNGFSTVMDNRKQYGKERSEVFLDMMIYDFGMAKKLGNLMPGWGVWNEAFTKLDLDWTLQRGDKAMSKINRWKDVYSKEADKSPLTGEIEQFLVNLPTPPNPGHLKNAKYSRHAYRVAGAMLYMMEKTGHICARGMTKHTNKGLWVEKLLGSEAKQHFLQYVKNLEEQAKREPDNEEVLRRITQAEARFINVAIDGGYPSISPHFVAAQKFYGITFADQVMESEQMPYGGEGSYGKMDGVAKAYIDDGNFDHKFTSKFIGEIKKNNMATALGALVACANMAEKDFQREKVKMGIILLLLTGHHLYAGAKNLVQYLINFSRKIGFLPGMMMDENLLFQRDTSQLLQMVTGTFLNASDKGGTGYQASNFGPVSFGDNGNNFVSTFTNWWGAAHASGTTNGKKVLNFVDMKNITGADSLIARTIDNKSLENFDDQEICDKLIEASKTHKDEVTQIDIHEGFYNNPLTAPKIIANKMTQNVDTFTDRAAERFWSSLSRQIPVSQANDARTVSFVFEKLMDFLATYYHTNEKRKIAKTLGLIKNGAFNNARSPKGEAYYMFEYSVMWPLRDSSKRMPKEVEQTIRRFRDFLYTNAALIDGSMVEKVLGGDEYEYSFNNPGYYINDVGHDPKAIEQAKKQLLNNNIIKKETPVVNDELRQLSHRSHGYRGEPINYHEVIARVDGGTVNTHTIPEHEKNDTDTIYVKGKDPVGARPVTKRSTASTPGRSSGSQSYGTGGDDGSSSSTTTQTPRLPGITPPLGGQRARGV